jgi:hypothetical protein
MLMAAALRGERWEMHGVKIVRSGKMNRNRAPDGVIPDALRIQHLRDHSANFVGYSQAAVLNEFPIYKVGKCGDKAPNAFQILLGIRASINVFRVPIEKRPNSLFGLTKSG